MEVEINVAPMLEFLSKVSLGGLIQDAVIQASGGKMFARFKDSGDTMYSEVYESRVRIIDEGSIYITSIKPVIQMIKRSDSKTIRLKSNSKVVCIYDGKTTGKMRVTFQQAQDESVISSFKGLKARVAFDKETLKLNTCGVTYSNGIQISKGILDVILKDAKAFGFEVYKLTQNGKQIECFIENPNTGDKFTRTISEDGSLTGETIESSMVGVGFRNMIDALPNDANQVVTVYIDKNSWLITDRETYYYNLYTAVMD